MQNIRVSWGLGRRQGLIFLVRTMAQFPAQSGKRKAYGEGRVAQPEFLFSEHMMAAMGQVFHMYTPIQMASVVQAIANNGVRMTPRLAARVVDSEHKVVEEIEPKIASTLDVEPEVLSTVMEGMLKVTSESKGTAYWIFYDLPLKVGGKTGTAQNPLGEDHAWFVGFGPYEDPEIALAVVVDQGGSGSGVAAPVAREIFDAFVMLRNPTIQENGLE